jgi:uncharacterized protein with HEPN domain
LPSDNPILRLEDILENIDRIARYTQDYDFQLFARDQQCQDAVERCLLRIAEAARKLEGIVESIVPDQPWSDIRAVGNVLRHEYDDVDPVVIWKIVAADLPPLKQAVETAVKKLQAKNHQMRDPGSP